MYLDALNKKYIGGFENLVHKRDLDTNITLKIEYDKGDTIGSSYAYLYELLSEELDIQLSSPVEDAQTIAVEFEIAWHKLEKPLMLKRTELNLMVTLLQKLPVRDRSRHSLLFKLHSSIVVTCES